ncbi:hypothetical protein [Candidatus Proelusimicrobium excrementi]|uniref:hypothetical protein n=1 Tax=Candidatus Proelusimicrobium excrementi TaxID=3416222 RepID=UPI003CA36708|nr:hypothetical protein [Elusimicrobiaceae bacterium]MBR3927714.1 hypothetical protein [Clostridia bacterium]
MGSLSDAVLLLNVKAEVDSIKRREVALIYAMQEMEKERIKMHAALFDANRCADCIRLNDCKSRKDTGNTYSAKIKTPESFCSMWEYGGSYTPANELLLTAMGRRGGKEKDK